VFKKNFGAANYDFITLMPVWLSWCTWHFCKGMELLPLNWSHVSSLSVSYVILLTSIFQTCTSQLVCHRGIWNTWQKDLRFYKMQAYAKRILDKKKHSIFENVVKNYVCERLSILYALIHTC